MLCLVQCVCQCVFMCLCVCVCVCQSVCHIERVARPLGYVGGVIRNTKLKENNNKKVEMRKNRKTATECRKQSRKTEMQEQRGR